MLFYLRRGLLCLALFVFPLVCSGAQTANGGPNEVVLTILHTNDVHGHLLPFAYTEIGRGTREMPDVGGAARRATLIRQIKREATNPVIVIDSGDTFTRGPFATTYEGVPDIEAMNAIGYDLAELGNNEFKAKDGVDQNDAAGSQAALLRLVKRSRFPWICANVTDEKGAVPEGVEPFVVRQFGPLRVGFLGLVTPRVGTYPQAKGWTVEDDVAAAKRYIPLARAQCDVLIAVTHIGFKLDKQLAAQTTGIDAIVGGDSHDFLYKAVAVPNADGTDTIPIVQAGEFGVELGCFDLRFVRDADGHWHRASYHYALLPIGPGLKEAPDVNAAIAPFVQPLMTVVGRLPKSALGTTPDERERQTTQVVVDALRKGTGADYSLNLPGSGFFNVFRSPIVRRYDVLAVIPFHNDAVVASMSGAKLRSLIAANPSVVVSGDASAIDPAKTYSVAFVDFIAKSDYKLPESAWRETGKDVRDLVIAYLSGSASK